MSTPPPLPTELAQAQRNEGKPEVAVGDYTALFARCKSGTATELLPAKDDCGTAAFRLAQSLERAERYTEAAQVFAAVRTVSRDPVRIARAQVRLATLQAEHLGDRAAALQTCRQVLTEFPAEVPAEDALHLLVRLQTESGSGAGQGGSATGPGPPPQAVPQAEAVHAGARTPMAQPGPSLRTVPQAEAVLAGERAAAAELTAELDRLAEALRPYETVASFALLYGARSAERADRPAEALAHYDAIVQRYPRGPLLDDALAAAARLLRKLGRSAAAAERLARLVQTYAPASLVGHYNQALLIESMLLLGEVYLRELHQPAQAIATLKLLLLRQPSSRLGDDALLLMAEAALLLPPPGSAADRAEACGYLSRLQRDYPDSNHRRAAQKLGQEQQCR